MLRLSLLSVIVCVVYGQQKCTRDGQGVMRYNGKACASTTRYVDGHKGACGCGDFNSDNPFSWNMNDLVTAPNGKFFDDGGDSSWCGRNCGRCVQLTPTGGYVPGQGSAPSNMSPQIFMVTNDCPIQGNEEWCGQAGKPGTNQVNTKGYEVHFDLQNQNGQISGRLGWDNPEVTWEMVNCPGDMESKWHQCQCFSQSGK